MLTSPSVDLAEAALLLAEIEYDVDWEACNSFINDLARRLGPLPTLPNQAVERLRTVFFEESGLKGNRDDYFDAKNSFLNLVIVRKLGIPITLSVLAISAGTRAGWPLFPVGYPGHFLVKFEAGDDSLFIDTFNDCKVVGTRERAELLQRLFGEDFVETSEHLRVSTPQEVIARMLNNLKAIYISAKDYPRAIEVLQLLTEIGPEDSRSRHDLAVILMASGDLSGARREFERYLQDNPASEDIAEVKKTLSILRQRIALLN